MERRGAPPLAERLSGMANAEWAVPAPLVPAAKPGGRPALAGRGLRPALRAVPEQLEG